MMWRIDYPSFEVLQLCSNVSREDNKHRGLDL